MSNTLLADAEAQAGSRPWLGYRRRWLMPAGIVALLLVLALALHWFAAGRFIVSTDDAYVGANITDIAPQVSGLITAIAVGDDQRVRAGDLLMQIDPRPFAAAQARAQAAIAADQAGLANLAAIRTLQFSIIAQAQATVASADSQLTLARLNQGRYARLAASHAGSVQDEQTASANFAQAQAALNKAQAALAAAQAQLAVIATQVAQMNAAAAGAQADESIAALDLGFTRIRAPFDGIVGNRSAHQGGYATAGVAGMSIVPAAGLWVDANFKEDQLARIRPGQMVRIVADIDPGVKITGHVAELAPASGAVFSILPAENATGNFTKIVQRVPVRILLDGDSASLGLLRPGLSVTAAINTR